MPHCNGSCCKGKPEKKQCDVCGKMKEDIVTIQAYGLDTDSCGECREVE